MATPSESLLNSLRTIGLGTPADLRRAARYCRAFSQELAAFDSVWIDAFLQAGLVTAFQADCLHAGEAHCLRLGTYRVLQRLGGGCGSDTYLAQPVRGGSSVTVKVVPAEANRIAGLRQQFEWTAELLRSNRAQSWIGPTTIESSGPVLWLISPHVIGETSASRLVRRGRFPVPTVLEIAQQLLKVLEVARTHGLPHGDIRLSNLILSPQGDAVLVDWGVRPILHPSVPIHPGRSPEWYEGVPPERIGSGAAPTIAGDAYAVGSLLWHMLAGRPAFSMGDPLARLAAHRTKDLPDIRDFAPDTPDELAQLIAALTDRVPEARPTDFLGAAQLLPAGGGRVSIRLCHSTGTTPEPSRQRWPSLAGVCLTLLIGGGVFWQKASPAVDIAHPTITKRSSSTAGSELLTIPPPDEQGIVELATGEYAAAELSHRGKLTIRGPADHSASIVVGDWALRVMAEEITLENVQVRCDLSASATARPPALVMCESQNLNLKNCRIESKLSENRSAGIAWRMVDCTDPTAGHVNASGVVCRGTGQAFFFSTPPRKFSVEQSLFVGVNSVVTLRDLETHPLQLTLNNVTVRRAAAVVAVGNAPAVAELTVHASGSILSLESSGTLFMLTPAASNARFRWTGDGTVVGNDLAEPLKIAGPLSAGLKKPIPVIDGLVYGEIVFAGPESDSDAASVAIVRGVPRRLGQTPGIELSRLPRAHLE